MKILCIILLTLLDWIVLSIEVGLLIGLLLSKNKRQGEIEDEKYFK